MNRLKAFREQKGMTQKELAAAVGIQAGRYNHYELGRRELPVSIAKEIGRVLEVDWWELYE